MTRGLGPAALIAVLLLGLLPAAVAAVTLDAIDDLATVVEDGAAQGIDVLANDAGDGPPTIDSVGTAGHGAVVIDIGGVRLTYRRVRHPALSLVR